MDPTTALANIRDTRKQLLAAIHGDRGDIIALAEKLAEQFDALDDWLTRGGFHPYDWE